MSEYIGKRVVPRHEGVWDANKSYEPLCLVLAENGDSYISRRDVPAGVPLSNESYWSLCQQFSEQLKLMGDHMDRTVSGMKQANADTLAEAKKRADENIAVINKTASDTVAAVNQTAAETVTSVNRKTDAVVADTQRVQKDVTARMEQIEARQEANVTASTVPNADYAAEVVDARVDADGNAYPSLGEAVRRFDPLVRSVKKVTIAPSSNNFKGEAGNESTGEMTEVKDRERTVALDVILNYLAKDKETHCVRCAGLIDMETYRKELAGKKVIFQVYSSADMEVQVGFGFAASIVVGRAIIYKTRVVQGINEFVMDLGSEEFLALPMLENWFYVHLLWGDYLGISGPPSGRYEFTMSVYPLGNDYRSFVRSPYLVQSEKAGVAVTAERASYSAESDHASDADSATKAGMAQSSVSAGVRYLMDGIYTKTVSPDGTQFDAGTGYLHVVINKNSVIAGDKGFSTKIGTRASLTGKKLVLYRSEAYHLDYVAVNAGNSWGNSTYANVNHLFTPLTEHYSIADFDAIMERIISVCSKVEKDFEGDIYLMIYGNTGWDMSVFDEGNEHHVDELHNYYCLYEAADDAVIYSKRVEELAATVGELQGTVDDYDGAIIATDALRQECTLLRQQYEAMQGELEKLRASNVLWGKKWVACGDSFTEGDYSGADYDDWKTEDGKRKTYPFFIGQRNNMTIVNEAKCGSIMPLSKQYLADPVNYTQNYRNPFSLERYKAIPTDADYITLWFGINDSGNTNLGTITDTTNETFYGAWNVVLTYLIENHPFAKIGIIITNSGAASYREAERQIARKYGIPYLDMMGDEQVPVIFYREPGLGLDSSIGKKRYEAFRVASTNGHPGLKAHEYQSTFIEAFLRRL